ncbi:MAG: CapA family protein [bacterium]
MLAFVLIIFIQNPAPARISFCAVGDILLDRGIRRSIAAASVDHPFENVTDFINEFDLAFCNLECPVSATGKSTGKIYCFRADTNFFLGVKNAGFNVFSLANNHIIDWGEKSCLDTKELIEKNELFAFGAGKDQTEALEPLIVSKNGLRIAFLGSVGTPLKNVIWPITKSGPGQATLEQLTERINVVRNYVDFVVVSMHWGIEYEHIPRSHQITWAHALIDAGADLIIGHHPHVLQSIEVYENRIILYSLGNFVFDQHKLYQRQSGVFSCIFKSGRIDSACFHPVMINNFQPEIAQDTVFKVIAQKMNMISERYNAVFFKKNNQLFITDSSCVLHLDTPIMRTKTLGMTILVNRSSIEMYDSSGLLHDKLILQPDQEIKDCCFIEDSAGCRLFTLISRANRADGDFISQFRINEQGIIPESCIQNMNYRLCKILTADIDCDSVPEICIGAYKIGTIESSINNLLLFRWNGVNLHQMYTSSKKLNPFVDFVFMDIDNDGLDDLISLEPCPTETYTVVVYQWLGFDFMKYRELITGLKETWLSDIDLKQLISTE